MKNRLPALRKAAILIASLDRSVAAELLDQMSPEQAEAVEAAIESLGPVPPDEQQTVIDEFFRLGPLVPEKTPPGIELDGPLARQFQHSDRSPARTERAETRHRPRTPPFQFLEEATSPALSRYLQREHPQTVAVVVSHLAPERAAEVLALLPPSLQGDVSLRLAHLDETDPEILSEIERGMQAWLSQQPRSSQARGAGLETLRGILAAADEQSKSVILRNLAQRDRQLAGKLTNAAPRELTFAQVEQLDDFELAAIWRQAGHEVALLALAGSGHEFVRRSLAVLPADDARRLRDGLDRLGPTRLSDVEMAQQQVAEIADRRRQSQRRARQEMSRLSVAV